MLHAKNGEGITLLDKKIDKTTDREKAMARTAPQLTFIHPQWKGANVHAKNDEGNTLLDCIYGQLSMHINAQESSLKKGKEMHIERLQIMQTFDQLCHNQGRCDQEDR